MKPAILWIGRIAVGVVIVGAIIYARSQVTKLWLATNEREQEVVSRPEAVIHASNLKNDLAKHAPDINRISAAVLTRDQIAGAVSALEEDGRRQGVEVVVSDITEVIPPQGSPTNSTLQGITLHVMASGEPQKLLTFLYRVEHAPFLLYVDSWSLGTDVKAGTAEVSSAGPSSITPALPTVTSGALQADVIMFVRHDE